MIEVTIIPNVGWDNLDVVDLNTAKQLKGAGYDKPSYYYWQDRDILFTPKGLKRVKQGKRRMNHNKYESWIYSAPTRKEVEQFIRKLNK
tara:strand:- start:7115 stop:7381 length:267 start_codon:yes stop_codon:yes gene_type:complete